MEGDSLLLLEEPELSLHGAIVSKLPALMYKLQKQNKRQIMLSSHSADLLSSKEIGGEEVLLLKPDKEGTNVNVASDITEVKNLLEGGLSIADAVLPRTVQLAFTELQLELPGVLK